MDQFAFHDIPDSIDYILLSTAQPSLSYIGFSQGTAQAFATLSIHPTLNEKVDVFIALAPAMSPAGLQNGVVDALVKASPEVLFLAFGRRSLLSSAIMWQSILYPPIFVRIIDMSLSFLFNWSSNNISAHQKLAAYPHLYSFTSTKSVVHWFQIIRNKSFQMFDDDVQAPLSLGSSDRYYRVAKFPTRNIKTPIVLVYGGSDSLVDIKVMLKELPRHTMASEVPHFEHLDFLWGQEVDTLVFPHVFDALDAYAGRDHRRPSEISYRFMRNRSLALADPSSYSEDELSPPSTGKVSATYQECNGNVAKRNVITGRASTNRFFPSTPQNRKHVSLPSSSSTEQTSASMDGGQDSNPRVRAKLLNSVPGNNVKHTRSRSGSISSSRSFEGTKSFSEGGISIGAGKATTRISDTSQLSPRNEKECKLTT